MVTDEHVVYTARGDLYLSRLQCDETTPVFLSTFDVRVNGATVDLDCEVEVRNGVGFADGVWEPRWV